MKDTPSEAEISSHRLMLRAGLIRRLSGGLYTFLPLGLRSLQKVQQIIREEMNRAGALECLMPALQPREIWEKTGRYETLAGVMFKMLDRQEREMVLGPTHEEVITDLAAREITSYKQLPVNFYQIQTKFRDEIRPRFGLMRAKEFIMKDAYSFDADWDGVAQSYQAMYDAYTRIFQRCGLFVRAVEADTGAMGGDASHEFMVLADTGEDGIVDCEACGYAANLEKAEARIPSENQSSEEVPAMEEVSTPGQRTIEEVSTYLSCAPADLLKTLIYAVGDEFVAVCLPGDRDVNELKLAQALGGGEAELASAEQVLQVTGAPQGFAGPVGLSIPVLADRSVETRTDWCTGANKDDVHLRHVDLSRDAGEISWQDLQFCREGDGCPRCEAGVLREKRGIEVGHVFKLGTKYSESLGATFLDAEGKSHPAIMGCYGIGVSRTLQSVIEQHHDKDGIIWPLGVAPFSVEILPLNTDHEESMAISDQIASTLDDAGIDYLIDDRKERPGVKFKDADLLGLPLRIGIGERSLNKGVVEFRLRRDGEVVEVPVNEAAAKAVELIQGMC
jgi:prolyl-tRNA synthetase